MSAGFGPQEAGVLRVFADAGHLPPERLPELVALASNDDSDEVALARRHLARLRRDRTLGPWLDEAETTARRWASELRYDHLVPMGGYEMGSGVDPRARAVAMRMVFEAAAALIARDRLGAQDFEALFGTWWVFMQGAPLPEVGPG